MEKEYLGPKGQKKHKTQFDDVWDNEIDDLLYNDLDRIPEGICCICGHKLSAHVDEDEYWRCHLLAQDVYQCECRLVKETDIDKLEDFDLKKRMLKHRKEFEEGHG